MDAHQFQQFLQLQRQCAASNTHKLREFSGEGDMANDWRNWRHNFTLAVEINRWGNGRARNELASNMTGKAKSATAHIPILADDANPVLDLLLQYDAVFMPPANSTYLRVELAQARQKAGESILEWHNRCRQLHQRAHDRPIGYNWEEDVQLRDDFIRGLSSKKFKEGVMNRRPQTYQEALSHAHEAYAVDRALNPRSDDAAGTVSAISSRTTARCFWCRRIGHVQKDCRDRMNGKPRTMGPFGPSTRGGASSNATATAGRGEQRQRGSSRGRGGQRGRGRGGRFRGIPRTRFVAAINALEELYLESQEAAGSADDDSQQSSQDSHQLGFQEAYGDCDFDEAVEGEEQQQQGNE